MLRTLPENSTCFFIDAEYIPVINLLRGPSAHFLKQANYCKTQL